MKVRIIAVRYIESQIVDAEEFHYSVADALGTIEERNSDDRSVGYEPSWSVYLVNGQDWFQLTNYVRSGTRYDFIKYIDSEIDQAQIDFEQDGIIRGLRWNRGEF